VFISHVQTDSGCDAIPGAACCDDDAIASNLCVTPGECYCTEVKKRDHPLTCGKQFFIHPMGYLLYGVFLDVYQFISNSLSNKSCLPGVNWLHTVTVLIPFCKLQNI